MKLMKLGGGCILRSTVSGEKCVDQSYCLARSLLIRVIVSTSSKVFKHLNEFCRIWYVWNVGRCACHICVGSDSLLLELCSLSYSGWIYIIHSFSAWNGRTEAWVHHSLSVWSSHQWIHNGCCLSCVHQPNQTRLCHQNSQI